MYWRIGHAILTRQQVEGWGSRVIDRLSTDLRAAFPSMRGLSRSNLKYMRQMAATWSEDAIGRHPVGQLPWGHIIVLLGELDDRGQRDWYAGAAAERESLALAATRDTLLPGLMSADSGSATPNAWRVR